MHRNVSTKNYFYKRVTGYFRLFAGKSDKIPEDRQLRTVRFQRFIRIERNATVTQDQDHEEKQGLAGRRGFQRQAH